MRRLVAAAPLLGLLAAGCVTASVHRLDQGIRQPCQPEAIEVFESSPGCPYTVIAHIESRTRSVFNDSDDLRRKLIEEAARLGGDAVILGQGGRDSTPIILPTGMIMHEAEVLEADVIVFVPEAKTDAPDGA